MATFSVDSVRIAGIASCVPSNVIENNESVLFDNEEERMKYIQSTGVERRHIVDRETCSSDLCYEAAEKLIADLQWEKESIDYLIFISQTGDYIYPATACILQDRLGLSNSCMSFDITMGCSGWVYGMSVASSIVRNGKGRCLILNGETVSKTRSPYDRVNMITGDAGTATALEYCDGAAPMCFDLNTDGKGFKTIIIPDGGYRNMFNSDSLKAHVDNDGVIRNNLHTKMDGAGVFAFAISKAPTSIKNLMAEFKIDSEDIDYYLLHQANQLIINKISKKIFGGDKVISNLQEFGNTSSTSIPLCITSKVNHTFKNKKCIGCAFGVGLSWASIYFETDNNVVCPDLIQI